MTLWVPTIRSWALTRGFALHPGTRDRYEIRYTSEGDPVVSPGAQHRVVAGQATHLHLLMRPSRRVVRASRRGSWWSSARAGRLFCRCRTVSRWRSPEPLADGCEVDAALDELVRRLRAAPTQSAGAGDVDLGAARRLDRLQERFKALQGGVLVHESRHQA